MPSSAHNFTPPTPQQVRELLDNHPASAPPMWIQAVPWGILLLTALLAVATRDPIMATLPWLALGGVIGWHVYRSRMLRSLEARSRQIQELAALLHWTDALRKAWRLLPRLTATPPLYGSTVAVIADCLDRLGCYEAAVLAYDHLIERLPEDGPDAVVIRIHRAIAEVQGDQLLDADQTLRRLRGPIESGQYPPPLPAFYRLATLVQQVHTHHYAEAVADSRRMLRDLRPLGASAGFGHALVALAYHMLDGQAAQPDARRRAGIWWNRATLLVPAAALTRRFPALEVMVQPHE